MNTHSNAPAWTTIAILVARLIFAAIFIMACSLQICQDIRAPPTTSPPPVSRCPLVLAWLAALFETALALCLLTGAYFTEAALLAAAYVIFLAFAFHGPSHWEGNQAEFGFFIDHFTFMAGLLYAAVHGPGRVLAIRGGLLHRGCN